MKLIIGNDKRKKPDTGKFRQMTIEEVKQLQYGDHPWFLRNDGRAGQVKVNGKVKTWKKDASRIEVPCKYGLYEYHTFTERDIHRLLIKID